MADPRQLRDQPPHGVVRARRAARRGGDHDEGPLPVRHVALYTAAGCSLCERALEVVREAHARFEFELEVVDIGGDAQLEARYREHLPVVEIDGERAFVHFVDPEALAERLRG